MFKKNFYLVGLLLSIDLRASQDGENKENITTDIQRLNNRGQQVRGLHVPQQMERLASYFRTLSVTDLRNLSLTDRQFFWTHALHHLHSSNVYQNSGSRRERGQ